LPEQKPKLNGPPQLTFTHRRRQRQIHGAQDHPRPIRIRAVERGHIAAIAPFVQDFQHYAFKRRLAGQRRRHDAAPEWRAPGVRGVQNAQVVGAFAQIIKISSCLNPGLHVVDFAHGVCS
jgi:hypothetical protein